MPAYQLIPTCKDYIWGGQRLKTDFGIQSGLNPLSEAWSSPATPTAPPCWQTAPIRE
jgi:mannose-6-phosphate isomerase